MPSNKKRARLLSSLLAMMRAMAAHYQTAHWTARGDGYYGDHLLFERLYDNMEDEIDVLAEKIVGLDGDVGCVDLSTQMSWMTHYAQQWEAMDNSLVRRSVIMERHFQTALKKVFEFLDEKEWMTLGLDDFLMSVSSDHETHQYLLKQRLK